MRHLKKLENFVLYDFPIWRKNTVFENRALRITYGPKRKKIKEEWGKKDCTMRGSFISTLRVVLLGRSNQKGCDRKDMQHA